MNLTYVQANRMIPGPAGLAPSTVQYEGSDTLKPGYLVCANSDYGTDDSAVQADRWCRAEMPATGKLHNFIGVIAGGRSTYPAEPGLRPIILPGSICEVFTDQNCTIDVTLLTVKAGSYLAGGVGEGIIIGKALQTVNRSSVNGLVLCKLFGVHPRYDRINWKTPTSAVNAQSSAIWESCPWTELKEDPTLGIAYFDDFLGPLDVTTADGWTIHATTSGVICSGVTTDSEGGVLKLDSNGHNAADDGVDSLQQPTASFLLAAGRKLWFEARIKLTDATDSWFAGLCAVDASLLATGALDDVSDKAGFYHLDAGTDNKMSSITARTSADDATADVAACADATWVNIGFVIDGLTSIKFYVNGVLVETGTTAANLPNAAMCMSFAATCENAHTDDADLFVDWVKIAQLVRT